MKIYLIRHGETDLNKEKRLQGQSDFLLNEYGRKLAQLTGEALKDVPFDFAFSSPLSRALETTKLVLRDRQVPVITDKRIQEICFGEFEGKSYHPEHYELSDPDFVNFFIAPQAYKTPKNGEDFYSVIKRTGEFWNELTTKQEYQDKTILVSTHGCALKAILANIRHTPIAQFWGSGVHKNCAVTTVELENGEILIDEGRTFY